MSKSVVPAREGVVERMCARFLMIPVHGVRRCVEDLWLCCSHLGIEPDAAMVERLATSRLAGVAAATSARGAAAVADPGDALLPGKDTAKGRAAFAYRRVR